jgi:hypothetical protein
LFLEGDEEAVAARLDKERRFDPDLWVVEIEADEAALPTGCPLTTLRRELEARRSSSRWRQAGSPHPPIRMFVPSTKPGMALIFQSRTVSRAAWTESEVKRSRKWRMASGCA